MREDEKTSRSKQSKATEFGGSAFLEYIRAPAFKRLLNQIYLAQQKQHFKSVAVLSERQGEGKTFFISALALGYARFLKRRVLIMDTISQTRNESFYIGSVLSQEKTPEEGSFDHIAGSIDLITTKNLQREIHRSQLDEPDQDEGEYDTADFQIGGFIEEIIANYDLILLDTCALEHVSTNHLDPVILAKQADRAILVVTTESMGQNSLAQITHELQRAEVEILGVVGNRMPSSRTKLPTARQQRMK